ncbi:hypothetical protein [Brucella pseudogrignonensis]|uniref:hypothetical protein n=1 Tax=Brucella pseudogrignonensis TaxID=419475 RepID=UPI0013277462|nr:hypothetical protein [Brucella pseudogrignonensis]KAB2689217.1 N-acetyltransferase [Brucella pseudogrignonensis]
MLRRMSADTGPHTVVVALQPQALRGQGLESLAQHALALAPCLILRAIDGNSP